MVAAPREEERRDFAFLVVSEVMGANDLDRVQVVREVGDAPLRAQEGKQVADQGWIVESDFHRRRAQSAIGGIAALRDPRSRSVSEGCETQSAGTSSRSQGGASS